MCEALAVIMIKTSFINVDLELFSKESLAPLAEELHGRIFILQNGIIDEMYQLAFECLFDGTDAGSVLESFLMLIESLSEASKDKLSKCSSRVLDIGYESGEVGIITNTLSATLLSQVAGFGFDINITVYPVDTTEIE